MTDGRSPIERMIDDACGYDPNGTSQIVTLRCPSCGKTQRTHRDKTDPPNAVVVEAKCPDCPSPGFDEINYFDANGDQILEPCDAD